MNYYIEGYLQALKFSIEMLKLSNQPDEAIKVIENIYKEQLKIKEIK